MRVFSSVLGSDFGILGMKLCLRNIGRDDGVKWARQLGIAGEQFEKMQGSELVSLVTIGYQVGNQNLLS